jgi:hypothetical protein
VDIQVQDPETPKRLDQKRTSPLYIIIKMSNLENKQKILKVIRGKCQLTYKVKNKNIKFPWVLMAHTCNPSYSKCKDQEKHRQIVCKTLYSKKSQKKC